jgi:hypothetical protein
VAEGEVVKHRAAILDPQEANTVSIVAVLEEVHTMKVSLRLVLAIVATFVSATAFAASDGTPEGALIEIVLGPDVQTAEKHLPNSILEGIRHLDSISRAELESNLPIGKILQKQGITTRVPDDGSSLLVFENTSSNDTIEVRVQREISNGVDALVEIGLSKKSGEGDLNLRVRMQMEDGEWRVDEIERSGYGGKSLLVDDSRLLDRFRRGPQQVNESSAIGRLRTLNTALLTYVNMYGEIGFPSDLAVLSVQQEGMEPNPVQAGLLQADMAKNSFTSEGYLFNYTQRGDGAQGAYSVSARPVEFGKTGTSSFYTDESGVIRSTGEDREANVEDAPVQEANPFQ